ncbi:hypothetical protein OG806_25365 [Streptomyces sp. NBC_00882]|uniref:hypothetical protein n=1 Tax=Streptomyces TaxID=1883 RepID=UPI00386333C9|nr:hypothetical protein OG806_25365 [Streptomyces sp. NBC_00882]WSZ59482.1 hypothetical protein OH824_24445 [Streptomyces canus]
MTVFTWSWKRLARLAFIAEQFGYEYVDLQTNSDNKFVLFIAPDLSPEGRQRAAQNRGQYPDVGAGEALPPVAPDAIDLLKARMVVDSGSQHSDKLRTGIMIFFLTMSAVTICFRLRAETAAVVIVGIVWAALMALMPVLLACSRRYRAKYAAQLQDAGFTPVTDRNGRLRYVPPGGQLPGHGNPFAAGA